MEKRIAIIGAGNGGQAFAGYLGLKGFDISIFDVMQGTVDTLNKKGGVEVSGNSDMTGFGKIRLASTDIAEVLDGANVVLVILPSIYHDDIAAKMAPYLKDGQFVLLNPAAPLGTVAFKNELVKHGCTASVLLACSSTLLFAVRIVENGHVHVSGQKTCAGAAAFPSSRNAEAQARIQEIIPQLVFQDDIIRISLDNMNFMVHPGPVMLNTGRIEGGVDFEYYIDMTPAQCRLIEALERERMMIGKAYGLNLREFADEFKHLYATTSGDTVYEVLTNNEGYKGIKGPKTMENRYLLEDVPFALAAIKTLAVIANVQTPCIDAVVTLAHQVLPHLEEGRTIENLMLSGMTQESFVAMCRG